jgi:D-alanyl-lipoteichoic acid acyltransferase DltB (MBOAT superfamily)
MIKNFAINYTRSLPMVSAYVVIVAIFLILAFFDITHILILVFTILYTIIHTILMVIGVRHRNHRRP